jgi:hypothetical protein
MLQSCIWQILTFYGFVKDDGMKFQILFRIPLDILFFAQLMHFFAKRSEVLQLLGYIGERWGRQSSRQAVQTHHNRIDLLDVVHGYGGNDETLVRGGAWGRRPHTFSEST